MIKVVLVDNEKPLLDELEYLLNKYDNIEISAMFTDPVEALKQIDSLKPDAVFLDIDMPILNGLNLAREITDINKNTVIIFLTAFNDYAVQAFEINAIDYVMKPVRKDRLNITIGKLSARLEQGLQDKNLMTEKIAFLGNDNKLTFDKVIAFDGEEYNVIATEDILYIEVEKKDTIIFTKHGNYKTRKSLELWKHSLRNQDFFQCHRSFIVNLKHIVKISPLFNNNYIIKLKGTSLEIPISKSHITELKKILNL
jgi:DNA-binding LytR/AlgR family response regulator